MTKRTKDYLIAIICSLLFFIMLISLILIGEALHEPVRISMYRGSDGHHRFHGA